jgi:DNA repair exonuclease SbcCD ATPase subunit
LGRAGLVGRNQKLTIGSHPEVKLLNNFKVKGKQMKENQTAEKKNLVQKISDLEKNIAKLEKRHDDLQTSLSKAESAATSASGAAKEALKKVAVGDLDPKEHDHLKAVAEKHQAKASELRQMLGIVEGQIEAEKAELDKAKNASSSYWPGISFRNGAGIRRAKPGTCAEDLCLQGAREWCLD